MSQQLPETLAELIWLSWVVSASAINITNISRAPHEFSDPRLLAEVGQPGR